MKFQKIHLIPVNCKRCGKPMYASNRSIYGLNSFKQATGYLCQDCTTDDEKHNINIGIGQGIIGGIE